MDALVLGAGITGLAAARRLRREGLRVTVLEAAARPGGCLQTLRQDGFVIEVGPNTVLRSPELVDLCRDAGCEQRLISASPEGKKRYVVFDGRLQALPASPPALLRSPLLTAGAKLRLFTEPLRSAGPGPQETVGAFFRRRLGPQVAERLGDAMVTGIYAGNPDELTVGAAFPRLYHLEREHGSLIRGAIAARRAKTPRREIIGHDAGFATLAEELAEDLDLRLETRVTAITAAQDGFHVEASAGDSAETFGAVPRLVLALPQETTLSLLSPFFGATPLDASPAPLPSAPVAVVALGYPRERIGHPLDGFGFLVPHREHRPILGCLFPSRLFPGRAPKGCELLVAMVGGRRRSELAEQPEEELYRSVQEQLEEFLEVRGEPVMRHVQRWLPGIPQPTAAQAALKTAVATVEARHPGLTVLGNWRYGVGIPDCVDAGWSVEGPIS
ncbi:MAG: protoporphyrinogen oxidase [Acidobacteriota bacterium]|nr:protoporphyrinogen oxidase [Acidobacteriota bacterium]